MSDKGSKTDEDYIITEEGKISSNITLYLKQRFEKQSEWYSKRSIENKKNYKRSAYTIIIVGAIIPIINIWGLPDNITRIMSALLGVTIIIVTGIIELNKYQENWLNNRMTRETLKKEKELFLHGVGDYANLSDSDKNKLFVERSEAIFSTESSKFLKTFQPKIPSGTTVPEVMPQGSPDST
jgi:hypothetical protein